MGEGDGERERQHDRGGQHGPEGCGQHGSEASGQHGPEAVNSAVAAHPNGRLLQELLTEGMELEILSWKMDRDEPMAAAVIAAALIKPCELAQRRLSSRRSAHCEVKS